MGRFAGKVAVVTGGASGIGKAVAELLSKEGANVVVADINAAAASETADSIARDGGSAIAVSCDISQEAQNRELMSAAVKRFGRLDILVNSAARFLMKGGHEAVQQDWHDIFATNVAGTALCCRYAAAQMKETGGGSIVIVSSTSGLTADPDYATYSTSKAALIMLARSLAIDFGKWSIRVNSICPGAVATPALKRELERTSTSQQEFETYVFQRQCLKRVLQPDDIARCILFLASDDARAMTGSNIVADAGYTTGK
jgi:NAD(P)-dependent dehydrogenase (short-subunit alcohol dehydrogenase family)